MSNYGLSYADLLHNCGLASAIQRNYSSPSLPELLDMVDKMNACYVTADSCLLISHGLGPTSDVLCAVLPMSLQKFLCPEGACPNGFKSRHAGWSVALAVQNSQRHCQTSDLRHPRNLGLPQKLLQIFCRLSFFTKLLAPVDDSEDGGCPTSNDPSNTALIPWPLFQSDCATSFNIISKSGHSSMKNPRAQMPIYSWSSWQQRELRWVEWCTALLAFAVISFSD